MTTRTRPTADSTAPTVSKGRVRIGRQRVLDAGGSAQTITAMISAWKTNAARQLIAVVIRPPISGPAAAPIPPGALIAPNARAREVTSVNSRVVRM